MKFRTFCRFLPALAAIAGVLSDNTNNTNTNTTSWSTRMIQGIMSRKQGIISSGAATSTLESGILSYALEAWLDLYSQTPMVDGGGRPYSFANTVEAYLSDVLNTISASFPTPQAASLLPMDRLSVGYALLNLPPGLTGSVPNATETIALLNTSLIMQPRTYLGGMWYYDAYPAWSYLDGAVSFLPFMLATGWNHQDICEQIELLVKRCYDVNGSGLLVHGYDASGTAVWVKDPATGASPFVWGRSMGWFVSGLVSGYEIMTVKNGANQTGDDGTEDGSNTNGTKALRRLIGNTMYDLAEALIAHADNATGAWWQLPTLPEEKGNFLESSSTALFAYALLKARRLGIAGEDVVQPAIRAYEHARDTFVVQVDGDGTLGYNNTVAVCSLNSTATFEYYTTRPLVPNSLLGEAAFVLASLEVERLTINQTTFGSKG